MYLVETPVLRYVSDTFDTPPERAECLRNARRSRERQALSCRRKHELDSGYADGLPSRAQWASSSNSSSM